MKQLDLFASGREAGGGPAEAAAAALASPAGGAVLVARGALASEELLFAILDDYLAAVPGDPSLLALPLRVVVPSRSLRLHVAAALVRRRARAAAGVVVQTLHGLACEILERAGDEVPPGMLAFEVLAERLARAEPELRRGLGDLVDGFTAVASTLADLLDAGFEPAHAGAAEEVLASEGRSAGAAEVLRARALVRVAARAEEAMRHHGLARRSTVLRRAAERLAADPARVLPARLVLLHGFAAASGVAADLLQALARHRSARLLLDRPPRPAGLGEADGALEQAFTEPLAERLGGTGPGREKECGPIAPPRVESFSAAGAEGEARELARRLRALLDAGARPEGIGVVARDLAPYRLALRRHLRRLGVPFSGIGEKGALTPGGRRGRAVVELLRQGEEVAADRWLDACEAVPSPGPQVDLRLAFHALGAGRLHEVAELRSDDFAAGYALPVRLGLATAGAPDGARSPGGDPADPLRDDPEPGEPGGGDPAAAGEVVAARRRVSGRRLRLAIRAAVQVRARLGGWPAQAPAAAQLARLHDLLAEDLGWSPRPGQPLAAALGELRGELPGDLALGRGELALLVARVLETVEADALGGVGGGVQVLSAVEARARTFDHLFLAGLNREVFPRAVREDPLLSDELRRALRHVLPDVPMRRAAFDEERYLFAQLLSAAPSVTLSWQVADDDGKPLSPSPWIERTAADLPTVHAPALYEAAAAAAANGARPRPADEQLVLAALHGTRRSFGELLALALGEARAEWGPAVYALDSADLAAARLRVLDELDPDPRTPEGRAVAGELGPYLGFVGRLGALHEGVPEPRRRDLYVTALEALAGCPWQTFLTRLLRLEPPPDALGALPAADAQRLGNLVHAALARLVREAEDGGGGPGPVLLGAAGGRPRGMKRRSLVGDGGLQSIGSPPATPRSPSLPSGGEGDAPAPDARTSVVLVSWPGAAALDRLVLEEAERQLAADGLNLPGLARALALRALPLLAVARQVDWGEDEAAFLPVLGGEIAGQLAVRDAAGQPRTLHFRADRLDLAGGRLRYSDYKTGRAISRARRAETRRRHLLARVRAGTYLQAVAYLLSAGQGPGASDQTAGQGPGASDQTAGQGPGASDPTRVAASAPEAEGRYLFLRPELDAEEREYRVTAGDDELTAAFAAAVAAALGAWDAGSFFPRLVAPGGREEPKRCSFCTVAEACLRGDPGARRRLLAWAETARETGAGGGATRDQPAAAFLAAWDLPASAQAAAPANGGTPRRSAAAPAIGGTLGRSAAAPANGGTPGRSE
ncbi:MAG TPA: PD-(D/E)XK nuclease family protein [Thermoanaerobaculia bacterium]|nr:PD-(D/E)XK nuclease family protein [Thermoanaerobaculia bacterium]